MHKPMYFVGIDISSASFDSAVGQMESQWRIVVRPARFDNQMDGFVIYLAWLKEHGVQPSNSVLCMEATGVYGEALAHVLRANGYAVAIEPPLKVKRAFKPAGAKTDPVDSTQIAEYACRFWDELTLWTPRDAVLEQIKTLLTTREQLVVTRTAQHNALHALKRKAIRTDFAEQIHQDTIHQLTRHIQAIDAEIQRLIGDHPDFGQTVALLMSIPGVGLALACHMLVLLQSAPVPFTPKTLAAFVGICPLDNSSGSSLHATPTSRHYGPPMLRKLLFLAAMSVINHNPYFKAYFLRKTQQGKAKQLVLNNIANKILTLTLVIFRSRTPFIPNYRSIHPALLR